MQQSDHVCTYARRAHQLKANTHIRRSCRAVRHNTSSPRVYLFWRHKPCKKKAKKKKIAKQLPVAKSRFDFGQSTGTRRAMQHDRKLVLCARRRGSFRAVVWKKDGKHIWQQRYIRTKSIQVFTHTHTNTHVDHVWTTRKTTTIKTKSKVHMKYFQKKLRATTTRHNKKNHTKLVVGHPKTK